MIVLPLTWLSGKSICLEAAESGLVGSCVKSVTHKLVFTASLLASLLGQCGGEQPASLVVVALKRALSGILPSWRGRQMAGNS